MDDMGVVCSCDYSVIEADSDIYCNHVCCGVRCDDSRGVCSDVESGHDADSDIDCNNDCCGIG